MTHLFIAPTPPSFTVTMGPFIVSVDELNTALISMIIVIPMHLLIVILFKKAGPKVDKTAEKYEEEEKEAKEKEEEGEGGGDSIMSASRISVVETGEYVYILFCFALVIIPVNFHNTYSKYLLCYEHILEISPLLLRIPLLSNIFF